MCEIISESEDNVFPNFKHGCKFTSNVRFSDELIGEKQIGLLMKGSQVQFMFLELVALRTTLPER